MSRSPSHFGPFDPSTPVSRADFLRAAGTVAGVAALASAVPLGLSGPAIAAAAQPLATRVIPRSANGERVPVIGLGTRAMSRKEPKAVAGQGDVIKTLLEGGGRIIDTAAGYTGGDSEDVIGEALQKTNMRKSAFLVTKLGERGKEAGIQSIENSFKQLRTDVIDVFFVHNMVDIETQLPTLAEYKSKGKIRYIGITDTGNSQDALIKYLDQCDFIEFAYAADYRAAENRLLPAAMDKRVATLIALPLGRGRALSKVKGQEVPQWAKEELGVTTFAQLLLKFAVSHPAVTAAIPSTLNPHHMAENLDAGRGPIPDAKQRERIADIWKEA
jgi:aryl-alcohol dehydrogenase-like predicted oxidoreductase